MRINLKQARRDAGMTQQQVADHLEMSMRNYSRIESGEVIGSVVHWDALEDLLGIHQRILRVNEDSHRGKAAGQSKPEVDQPKRPA